jgi:alcohol oxidase
MLTSKSLDVDAEQTPHIICARKIVVVSSGAMATPLILERSGVGKAERLEGLGIECISDIPGVGENYQDHQLLSAAAYELDAESDDTGDDILRGDPETHARLTEQFKSGKGGFAWNYVDAGVKYRPTEAEVNTMGLDFQNVWNTYFAHHPDKPLFWMGFLSSYILKTR